MTFDHVQHFIRKIAPLANLSAAEIKLLETPIHIHKAELTVNGKKYPAYRVQFNNSRGPYKGGIRFHPEVDEDEVKSLAFWMSLKTAVADIPLGGGKGGITVDPKSLSEKEMQELSRAYVRAFADHLGSKIDIPAPDVYTNGQIMAWMLDEYEKKVGHHDPGMITGKPLELGGSLVRDIATALGGVYVLEEAIKKLKLKGKSVVIQGFGNAGMNVAKLLSDRGFSIIAVSDSKGGIYAQQGLPVDEVVTIKEKTGSVQNYHSGKKISNEELLTLTCDILIPSALSSVITEKNADKINARIILELANGPTTPTADEILHRKKILVLPDILANAGGVTVSYFEWVQNRTNYYWTAQEVETRLKEKMVTAFHKVWDSFRDRQYDFRTATYIHALHKILTTEKIRGRI
ncbi:Glu/Leu/Phe/Val dehydrogenase [Candidatus Woesearchaeota archaeon]|nr:Glu/Leu/Phe/Val dehydrogenase [Candidatus Woesearchaeota archaeon]